MSRHSSAIRIAAAVLAVALSVAGCGKPASRHSHTQPVAARHTAPTTAAPPSSAGSAGSAPAGVSPVEERAALDAVAVARAFTTAVCPYSWHDPIPYGQRLIAALTRWATPEFAAAHRWSPARTATAAAGLAEHQAQQTCAATTGGLEPEADPAAGTVAVRLSVTVTAQAQAAPASSAQETFNLQLARRADGGWLISSGQW